MRQSPKTHDIQDLRISDVPYILPLNNAHATETSVLDETSLNALLSMAFYARGIDRGATALLIALDHTASYINRFHTIKMELNSSPNPAGLPFTLVPRMMSTTLLWSGTDLVYGTGANLGVPPGVPPVNDLLHHFFTGRSDNFDASQNSGNPTDARFDSETIRISNDKRTVFISDDTTVALGDRLVHKSALRLLCVPLCHVTISIEAFILFGGS